MKRLIISIFAFFVLCLSSFAQSEHLTFKGIPIDGSLEAYVNKMKKAGFEYVGEADDAAMFKGEFAGYKNCSIGVITLKKYDLVNRVSVLFQTTDSWQELYANYTSLQKMLTKKYGKPADTVELFEGDFQPGDDMDRMRELRMDRCKIYTVFTLPKGTIQLEIIKGVLSGGSVRLSYWDKLNTWVIEEKAMEDL